MKKARKISAGGVIGRIVLVLLLQVLLMLL